MTDPTGPRSKDHWWWRPGWSQGTRFYTWHLTFEGQLPVHQIADTYRRALARHSEWDLVPDKWLHLTMQGLGFIDDVSPEDLNAIVEQVRRRLAGIPAFTLKLDRPTFTPEAIRWDPQGPVHLVRNAIRDAVGSVWTKVPEQADGFTAHITIAYANSSAPAQDVLETIDSVSHQTALAVVNAADLIVLNRDSGMYEWEHYATARLEN